MGTGVLPLFTAKMGKEIPAVTKLYDIILWIFPQVEKLKRDYKLTNEDRIVTNLLDSLETIIEAVYTKEIGKIGTGK